MNIEKIIEILQKRYKIKIWKENPFKILITTILSQRTKDEVTREAAKRLFRLANKPEKILKLSESEIKKAIKPVGFFNQKAKRIKKVAEIILKKYKGKVPDSREELLKLPGVGFKTADVVLCYGFGKNVIPVDTHVATISRRLKLTESKDPEKIREDLHAKIPEKYRRIFNLLMVEFGKDVCKSVKPKCEVCPIKKFCPSFNENFKIQSKK